MPIKFKEILKILNELKFEHVRTKWSHYRFEKNWYWITIPHHKEFKTKTAKTIIKQISKIEKINEKELIKKYNLKF